MPCSVHADYRLASECSITVRITSGAPCCAAFQLLGENGCGAHSNAIAIMCTFPRSCTLQIACALAHDAS